MKFTMQHDHNQRTLNDLRSWLNDLRKLQAEFPHYSGFTAAIEATLKSIDSVISMRAHRPLQRGSKNMQVNFVGVSELASLLQDSETMQVLEHEGQTLYELHFREGDVLTLAIANPSTGEATCANPCASVDSADGSIHDQARLQRV